MCGGKRRVISHLMKVEPPNRASIAPNASLGTPESGWKVESAWAKM